MKLWSEIFPRLVHVAMIPWLTLMSDVASQRCTVAVFDMCGGTNLANE